MKGQNSKFCSILCFEEQDKSLLEIEFERYQISVETFGAEQLDVDVPTLLVGWYGTKKNYQECRISEKKIAANLFWTFSTKEDKEQQKKDIEKFIKLSLEEFLPKNYSTFDCMMDGNILDSVDSIFEKDHTFCYFGKNNSLFVYGRKGFIGINLGSLDYIGLNSRSFIENVVREYSPLFLNFDNIPEFLKTEDFEIRTLENVSWLCSNKIVTETQLFKFSPLRSNEKDLVFFMSKLNDNIDCQLTNDEKIISRYSRKDIITDWLSRQSINFSDGNQLTLKYSNKRTITGRINCVDKKFNPQHLPRKSEERNKIVSRYKNGRITVFDYVSFETKLSVLLTRDQKFINEHIQHDLHVETAKIIYKRDSVSDQERSVGKRVNHSIIYGIGFDRLSAYLVENGFDEKESKEAVNSVNKFLKPILKNSKTIKEEFKKKGYILNPYNSVVYPQKEWAVYNNYVQSIAADLVVDKLFSIKGLLNNFRSKFMYQVYDSFVFDIHPDEMFLPERIKETLEKAGSQTFQVECVMGKSLMDCTSQKEVEEIETVD